METQRDSLRLVISGHVDHGKSTLIGRLLVDTNSVPEDRIERVKALSKAVGKDFKYSFLLDAFEEEQKQSITIDVSHTRFSSERRDYLILDAPGHREFLKNMFSGASQADAALLLLDATQGLGEQTRQHADLLRLLRVDQVIVVVSKMGPLDYSESVFLKLQAEILEFLGTQGLSPRAVIPVDSKAGDNLVNKSSRMEWFKGKPLLAELDSISSPTTLAEKPFRFCVQDVYKFDSRRLISGRVLSGAISPGDEVVCLPSNESCCIETIESWPEVKSSAEAGDSVAFTLNTERFLERGALLIEPSSHPHVADTFLANVFWMSDIPLESSRRYKLCLGLQEINCTIEAEDKDFAEDALLSRYDMGQLVICCEKPAIFDDFSQFSETGRCLILDEGQVCGAGVIELGPFADSPKHLNREHKSQHIYWQPSAVNRFAREDVLGHQSAIIWLTGLSGAGKSTIATELERRLVAERVQSYVLDGDNIRHGLSSDLGFSAEDRAENIRRVAETARLFADAGLIVVAAFISPFEQGRTFARNLNGERFIEVFVDCPLEVCQQRDPKGLYKKSKEGLISGLTGVGAPYEAPESPELVVKTAEVSVGEAVQKIISCLESRGIISLSAQPRGQKKHLEKSSLF